MQYRIFQALAALAALLAATTADADASVCGMSSSDGVATFYDDIVGFWESTEAPGYMSVQGAPTMPVGGGESEQILMWTDNGVLIGSNAEGPVDYDVVFEPADEPAWMFRSIERNGAVIAPTLSDQELQVLMDCRIEDLPRLIGRAEIAVPSGTMHLTLRLVYLGEIGMYGIGQWETVAHGRKAIIRKPISMTKEP